MQNGQPQTSARALWKVYHPANHNDGIEMRPEYLPRSLVATPLNAAETTSHNTYRRDIDGIRAIAVVLVLIFHAFPGVLPGGFVGVDVFFVISGFLITQILLIDLEHSRFSVGRFYVRRVRRIFPALLVILIACLAFGWKTLLAEDLAGLAKHVFGSSIFSSNLFLWQEVDYFDKASEAKPLLHLWSLGIEEQCYVVWPFLMWLARRRRVSTIAVISIAAIASFATNVTYMAANPTAAFYSPFSRAWELLAGAALTQLSARVPHPEKAAGMPRRLMSPVVAASLLSILGIVLIMFSVVALNSTTPFPGWRALIPVVGACLLIASGPGVWFNRVVLSSPPLVAIGLISYPLYLWHWPLLALLRHALPGGDTSFNRLLFLLLAFVLASITYQLIEKPFRFGKNVKPKVVALCAGMAAVAVVSMVIHGHAGFPSRYPEIIQRATEYDLAGYRAALRDRECFMEPGQDASQFSPSCVESGSKPLWVLWGDSGAG